MGEEQAIESLKAGATDYVLKHRLERLVPAVRRAFREIEDRARRHAAEQRLRRSEELFKQITDNVADLVAILDLQGRRLYNSPSYHKLFGDVAMLPGTDSFIEIHPADRERVKRLFDETVSNGQGSRCEFRFVLRDGSVRHIESHGRAIRDPNGCIVNVLVVSRDITGRRQAEEQLRDQAALLDKAQDAIVVCDLDYLISYWNKGAERIYGWTAEEFLGREFNDHLHPGESPAQNQARAQVLDKGEWMGELKHQTKSGQELTVQSRWTLARDHDAKPRACCSSTRTSPTRRSARRSSFAPSGSRASARLPAASRTTSTTCSPPSSWRRSCCG
jgi:PAS domain S-box-containing protein